MPHSSPVRFRVLDWSFTWDPNKARLNLSKHKVGFTEAATCFLDPHGRDGVDERNPSHEKLIAYSERQQLLLTVYVEVEGSVIRIISARPATRHERGVYEQSVRLEERSVGSYVSRYRWRPNPYAAALARTGIRVLASALPPDARSFESWATRPTRRSRGRRET